MTLEQWLNMHNACQDGKDYLLGKPNLQVAWNDCTYAPWMFWLLKKSGYKPVHADACIAQIVRVCLSRTHGEGDRIDHLRSLLSLARDYVNKVSWTLLAADAGNILGDAEVCYIIRTFFPEAPLIKDLD